MKVVGACLARTATNSLKLALERLLRRPCYHMWEAMEHPEHFTIWQRAVQGNPPDWAQFLCSYEATVDEPAAHFWEDLSDAFPEAFILLSVRDVDEWWQSCTRTVLPTVQGLTEGPMRSLMDQMWSADFSFDRYEESTAKDGYRRYIDEVRTKVSPDRLIEWKPGDGWAPLCQALDIPVPDEAFPHVNTTDEFLARIPGRLGEA